MTDLSDVSLVWFKRDLRLRDHTALSEAIARGKPIVLLYIFEPILLKDPHYDERHWRFIWQSLTDLNHQLSAVNTRVLILIYGP